jgi:type II secretory ATPase GspE/PulE/Tfp pilus assembly ATPase PilB-like protein
MIDLGVDRYAFANSLCGILHQRLVRRICGGCSDLFDYPAPVMEMLHRVGAIEENDQPLRRGKGCKRCNGTGFKGRVGVFELMAVTDPVREAMLGPVEVSRLHKLANAAGGLVTLARYAGVLIQSGITTPSEVLPLLPLLEA